MKAGDNLNSACCGIRVAPQLAIIESLQAEFALKERSKPSSLKERRHTDGTIGICTEREEPPTKCERERLALLYSSRQPHTHKRLSARSESE